MGYWVEMSKVKSLNQYLFWKQRLTRNLHWVNIWAVVMADHPGTMVGPGTPLMVSSENQRIQRRIKLETLQHHLLQPMGVPFQLITPLFLHFKRKPQVPSPNEFDQFTPYLTIHQKQVFFVNLHPSLTV